MPDLPSGTVTFLFTDIEGSTALWEQDRMAMATTVARHLTLLRFAIETHGGVLYNLDGPARREVRGGLLDSGLRRLWPAQVI